MVAQASSSPAWIPILAGAIGGVLALAGVALSQLVTWRQNRREHELRVEDEVKSLTVRLLRSANELVRTDPKDFDGEKYELILDELALVAPMKIVEAGHDLYGAVTAAIVPVQVEGKLRRPPDKYAGYINAHRALTDAVRTWRGFERLH
jgi:hypothetical protein